MNWSELSDAEIAEYLAYSALGDVRNISNSVLNILHTVLKARSAYLHEVAYQRTNQLSGCGQTGLNGSDRPPLRGREVG